MVLVGVVSHKLLLVAQVLETICLVLVVPQVHHPRHPLLLLLPQQTLRLPQQAIFPRWVEVLLL